MKPSELVSHWTVPDNSRLMPQQISFRLPVHVVAKLAALCEIFPNKTRTDIVGDLLSTALDEVIAALPIYQGRELGVIPGTTEPYYDELGPQRDFKELANRYFAEFEKEMGNEPSTKLYEVPDRIS